MLTPRYGWPHAKAGTKHPDGELSFRQTLTAGDRTSRGFTIVVNRRDGRLDVSFDYTAVDLDKHGVWLESVESRAGLGELEPQPYWGFDDIFHKAGTKLSKTLYAIAERKRVDGIEYFKYDRFLMLEAFRQNLFIDAIEQGDVLVDFDARTGHNHGTKFRLKQSAYLALYAVVEPV